MFQKSLKRWRWTTTHGTISPPIIVTMELLAVTNVGWELMNQLKGQQFVSQIEGAMNPNLNLKVR